MQKMNRFERVEGLLEYMTAEKLLKELIRSMSENEVNDNLDYIVRMWGIEEEEE